MKNLTKLFLLLACAIMPLLAHAQTPAVTATETAAEQAKETPKDPFGRETPAGVVNGFVQSVAREDYDRASHYLDLTGLPKSMRHMTVAEIAKDFQYLLDQSGYLNSRKISDKPEGNLDDGLPPEFEVIGSIKATNQSVKLKAQKTQQGDVMVWQFSSDTVAMIPNLMKVVEESFLNRNLPEQLVVNKWLGIPVGHWLTLLLLIPIAYLTSTLIVFAFVFAIRRMRRLWHAQKASLLLEAIVQPTRLFLSVWIYVAVAYFLGVSLIARQYFGHAAEVVAMISIAWLICRLIDVFTDSSRERFRLRGQIDAISIMTFFRRTGKFAILVICTMAILKVFGVNVSAALAALGIGGIAIALGAQKTVENFIGSLSVIADRPIRIGDFCRFGTVSGTVEDIGMRSTRIRTGDRTIVTIPNGEFATLQIENFARRDKIYFHPILELRYETPTEAIRAVLNDLRALLKDHEKVEQPGLRVSLIAFAQDSLQIEVNSYIQTTNFDEFCAVREELMLQILDVFKKNNVQLVYQPIGNSVLEIPKTG